jgi:hypothetical protein
MKPSALFRNLLDVEKSLLTNSAAEDEYRRCFMSTQPFFNETSLFHYNCLRRAYLNGTSEETPVINRILAKIDGACEKPESSSNAYKKAFLIPNYGLGDIFTAVGMVRYLATQYDEVKILVMKSTHANTRLLFSDDPSITFLVTDDDSNEIQHVEIPDGYDILPIGINKCSPYVCVNIPFCFYTDLSLPYSVFWDYFYIPTCSESLDLLRKVNELKQPYMFVHNDASGGDVFTIEDVERELGVSRNDLLVINPNTNMYAEDHPWHSIVQQFIGYRVPHYKHLLQNASIVVLSDSSFFCMAVNLDIPVAKCYYWARGKKSYEHFYDPFYTFDPVFHDQKPRFYPLVGPLQSADMILYLGDPPF